jgi:molecular chaperone GrpE
MQDDMTDTSNEPTPESGTPVSEAVPDAVVGPEAEIAALKDKLLRAMAEGENIRRRGEREREDTAKFAVAKFAQSLLPVSDNLRRAIESIPPEARDSEIVGKLVEGVEATERTLQQAFEKMGIKKIEALEQPFDANFHEVMIEVDAPDKAGGTVVQQFESGYMIHDRLLRPARVAIAKGAARERLNTKA